MHQPHPVTVLMALANPAKYKALAKAYQERKTQSLVKELLDEIDLFERPLTEEDINSLTQKYGLKPQHIEGVIGTVTFEGFYPTIEDMLNKTNRIMKRTFGEETVRIDFNPSDKSEVFQIKSKTAELLNYYDDLIKKEYQLKEDGFASVTDGNKIRLYKLAITALEESCMWGVKGATSPPLDPEQYGSTL